MESVKAQRLLLVMAAMGQEETADIVEELGRFRAMLAVEQVHSFAHGVQVLFVMYVLNVGVKARVPHVEETE